MFEEHMNNLNSLLGATTKLTKNLADTVIATSYFFPLLGLVEIILVTIALIFLIERTMSKEEKFFWLFVLIGFGSIGAIIFFVMKKTKFLPDFTYPLKEIKEEEKTNFKQL